MISSDCKMRDFYWRGRYALLLVSLGTCQRAVFHFVRCTACNTIIMWFFHPIALKPQFMRSCGIIGLFFPSRAFQALRNNCLAAFRNPFFLSFLIAGAEQTVHTPRPDEIAASLLILASARVDKNPGGQKRVKFTVTVRPLGKSCLLCLRCVWTGSLLVQAMFVATSAHFLYQNILVSVNKDMSCLAY